MLAFLGVKLSGEEIATLNCRAEYLITIAAGRGNIFLIHSVWVERVDEIKVGLRIEALPVSGIGILEFQGVPAHVGDFDILAGEALA